MTSKWNLDRILKVREERFDREFPPSGGFAKLREGRSIAVDSNDRNTRRSRGERVASETAREVDDHAQAGRDLNSRELVAEEVGGR